MGIKKACLSKCANTYYTSFHGREPQCDSLFLRIERLYHKMALLVKKSLSSKHPQNKLGKHEITGELKYVKHKNCKESSYYR